MSATSLTPGIWCVDVVETRKTVAYCVGETKEAARTYALAQMEKHRGERLISFSVGTPYPLTLQESAEWLAVLGQSGKLLGDD